MQAAVGTNIYLELELSTQVQVVMTSGEQHRSFQCGWRGDSKLGSLYVITYTAFGFGNLGLGFFCVFLLTENGYNFAYIFIFDYMLFFVVFF